MPTLRKASERGHARHGWLESFHTFSFAEYHDPAHMGFRSLRVINEDRVQPGQGFGRHSHRDMEILTWVIDGALEHRDGLGNGSVIGPGDLQRMSAGTGVTHSEYNASRTALVHFLQIWILPERDGIAPSYQQAHFSAAERSGRLRLLASRDGREGSVHIHQDIALYGALLGEGARVAHALAPGRHAWIQLVRGRLEANGSSLEAGDGARVSGETELELVARSASDVLVFDLA